MANITEKGEAGKAAFQKELMFPIGEKNPYGKFFDGQSYLASVSDQQVAIHNVTFEPGCRNHWHIHHAKSGGGQLLICVGGRGWYQAWGEQPALMTPGTGRGQALAWRGSRQLVCASRHRSRWRRDIE